MKTLKYFSLFFLLSISVYSQNIIDPPILPIGFDSTALFDRNFNDTTFIRGWNWGSPGRALDEAMRINFYHDGYVPGDTDSSDYTSDTLYIPNHRKAVQVTGVSGGRNSKFILNAHSQILYPVIEVDSTSNFVPRAFDSTGSVFGFMNKNKVRILNSTQDTSKDYHFVMLDKDSISSPEIVLSNIWKNNILRFLNYDTTRLDSYNHLNLRQMYFAINLKSFQSIPDSLLDDTVLTIKLPYRKVIITHDPIGDTLIYTYSDSLIKFNQISNSSLGAIQSITSNYGQYRGKFKSIISHTSQVFAITGAMLKFSAANPADSSLTLYSYFECNGVKVGGQFVDNPFLEPDWWLHPDITEYITNLDVEVKYHGKLDLGIRYCKFETLQNQRLTHGLFDLEIKNRTDTLLSLVRGNNNGVRINRFYADDEMLPAQWASNRYYNMLVDTMAGLESFVHEVNLPSHYLHATAFKEYWNGTNIRYNADNAIPFIRKGIFQGGVGPSPTVFNYQFGYAGNNNAEVFNDTLNSHYETFLSGSYTTIPITDPQIYEYKYGDSYFNYPFGLLFNVEWYMYHGYYKNRSMLYNNKSWWANLWVNSEPWILDPTTNSFSLGERAGRPKTGEEIRLETFMPVLLGAKGNIYYMKSTGDYISDTTNMWLGLQPWNRNYGGLTGDSLLRSNIIGGDFINVNNDPNGFHNCYNSSAYRWDLMNIAEDRIYIGLASIRTQIANLNKWIEHNNSLLMSLKLQAWNGKGFLPWYSQAPGLQDSIMKKFINISETQVRRFSDTLPEASDSVFYDIAIHKKNGISLDKEQYWAVQNRRTDPLICVVDTLLYDINDEEAGIITGNIVNYSSMKFYSTAELEEYAENGGNVLLPPDYFEYFEPDSSRWNYYHYYTNHCDTSYWRNLYWRRQGCREIKIKTAVIDTAKDISFKIEELTDGTEYDDNLPWWKKEEIHNQVKTVFKQGEYLTLKMLPGMGRMFKVNIITDNTNIINGELAQSNQTKMVAYPAGQSSNYDFWKDTSTQVLHFHKDSLLYYHIVYDRKQPNGLSRVYYRRSAVPYNRDINTKIINWDSERLISDTLVYTRADHLSQMDPNQDSILAIAGSNISCRYPSIVVRYNEAAQKAFTYIVFSCTNVDYPDTPRVFLVESAFPHDVSTQAQIPNFLKPIAYGYTGGSSNTDLEKFGGVSINASFSGNYYAWCDSIYGIGVGWKAPNNRGFITNKRFVKFGSPAVCTQPSLNTYSRMNINEENCALVYREFDLSFHKIIYTRLHNPGGQIDNYVQPQICGGGNGFNNNCTYSGNNKSVTLNPSFFSYSYNQAEFPVVYRPVDFARRPGFEFADSMMFVDAKWDRVYWQAKTDFYPSGSKSIFLKNIDISEPLNCWTLLPPLRLFSTDASLVHPSPGPGAPSSKTDGIFSQYALSDSSFILSFIRYPTSGSPDYNSDIHQINHNAWLSYIERWTANAPFDDMIDMNWSLVSIGKGKYPHTAHSPVITKNQDWYFQNRIFQTTGETIKTSAWWFLKGPEEELTIYPMLSLSDSLKNVQLSEIFMIDNNKSIGLKAFDSPEKGQFTPLDTIKSEWFRVDEIKELGFFSIVGDTSLYRIELESSRGKIDIPVRKDYSKFLTSRKITLLNGKNNLYRIKLIKRDKNINVWVDLLFDTKRDLAEMSNDTRDLNKSSSQDNSNHQIIDLGTGGLSADMDLRIFPNPASEFIYATGELLGSENQLIVYSLYNSAGLEVFKSEGISGRPIMIPTSDLTTGAYFLKAEEKNCDAYEVKHIISKSVIIQR